MKQGILLAFILILCACGTTKNNQGLAHSNSTEQIFVDNQGKGLPGKCYQKMMLENVRRWTEVICEKDIKKGLIRQVQTDLVRLNYEIDGEEVAKAQFGKSTKLAIKEFQIKNRMAYGGLDWATVNRLKNQ